MKNNLAANWSITQIEKYFAVSYKASIKSALYKACGKQLGSKLNKYSLTLKP